MAPEGYPGLPAKKYPAESISAESISAAHTRSDKPGPFAFHFHDNYELFFFLSGKADMFVEQSRYPLARGNLLLFNSNEIHRVFPQPEVPYERMTIHFDPGLIRALPLKNSNLLSSFQDRVPGSGNAVLLADTQFEAYYALVKALITHLQEPARDALALAALIQILAIADEAFSRVSPGSLPFSGFVQQAVVYIDENLTNPLALKDIAAHLSIDPFYLSHSFKQQTGVPVYHYVLIKKIVLAKTLLARGLSAQQTCEQAGFGDYNNFSRTFKKYVGVSPAAYKKQEMHRF